MSGPPGDCEADLEHLVEITGDLMDEVWANIESHAPQANS